MVWIESTIIFTIAIFPRFSVNAILSRDSASVSDTEPVDQKPVLASLERSPAPSPVSSSQETACHAPLVASPATSR